MEAESHSVLLVSRDNKIITQISTFLVPPLFDLTTTTDFNEARRLATERTFNIIIADSGDGYDTDFAIHTEPLIRREEIFQNKSPNERRALFSKLFYFVMKSDISVTVGRRLR